MNNQSVIVLGGGIAGLTAGALLAHKGFQVTLLEAHGQIGGCAGTFRRGPYVFDVGATQVAGLEDGGIHERIFRYLGSPVPVAKILDPACVIYLPDNSQPIYLWHDPLKWEEERNKQFPGSEKFWSLCSQIHKSNWSFAQNEPILPFRNFWDFRQFFKAAKSINFFSAFLSRSSVADLLWLCSCNADRRLRQFLDLQLRLYSQETADQTAALYGATVLQMAQAPLGLWHLQGSMQALSDHLLACFLRDGGELLLRHQVVGLTVKDKQKSWYLDVINHKANRIKLQASDLIFTLPPQSLLKLMSASTGLPLHYENKLKDLSQPSGAIVFYGALNRSDILSKYFGHIQFYDEELGSLFLSISDDGDGRAPLGQATLIASIFADACLWSSYNQLEYQDQKYKTLQRFLKAIHKQLNIDSKKWLHTELATPRSFAKWTGRPNGIVGGLGQRPSSFGPFGLPGRSPMKGLWLCGDSIYPGEGTAGVSHSAVMACRQLMSEYGRDLSLTS